MTRIPLTDSCGGADGASKLGASVGAIRGGGTLCAVRVGNDAATSHPRKEPNSTQDCHRGQQPRRLWNRIRKPNRHFRIQFIALHTRRSTDRSSSPLLESMVPMIGLLPKQPPTVTANSVAVADAEHAVRPNDEAGRNGFLRPRVTTKQCYHHPSLSVVCNWFRHISLDLAAIGSGSMPSGFAREIFAQSPITSARLFRFRFTSLSGVCAGGRGVANAVQSNGDCPTRRRASACVGVGSRQAPQSSEPPPTGREHTRDRKM